MREGPAAILNEQQVRLPKISIDPIENIRRDFALFRKLSWKIIMLLINLRLILYMTVKFDVYMAKIISICINNDKYSACHSSIDFV